MWQTSKKKITLQKVLYVRSSSVKEGKEDKTGKFWPKPDAEERKMEGSENVRNYFSSIFA
jgi:hypothetical protein